MNSSKDKYYRGYMKYKTKYLSLKTQTAGVTYDLMYDNYLNNNEMNNIAIQVLNVSGTDIKYKKKIYINAGDEKGYVYTENFESSMINRHEVDRGEIERLLKNLNIWQLPNAVVGQGYYDPDYLLTVTYGDKEWPSDKYRSSARMSSPDDIDDIYDNAITQVLSFE